jgi:hypothetical protein
VKQHAQPSTADTDQLAELIEALVRGEFAPCERLFSDQNALKPLIRWAPDPADVSDDRLRKLLQTWTEEYDRSGRLPHPDWVEPERLLFAVGYLMLLEAVDGARDFQYRLYGTEISRRFMRDLTGHRVSEVPFRMSRLFFLAVYQAACIRKCPIYTEHAPPSSVHVTSWSRMILPLSSDGDTVDRFLVGNIPGRWRGPDDLAVVR